MSAGDTPGVIRPSTTTNFRVLRFTVRLPIFSPVHCGYKKRPKAFPPNLGALFVECASSLLSNPCALLDFVLPQYVFQHGPDLVVVTQLHRLD